MKNITTLVFLLFNMFLFAQVGIQTENPQATLEIASMPDNNSAKDGILIPKLTGNQLKSKDALYDQTMNGTLIFITEAVASPSAKTLLVNEAGFYFYDATDSKWKKLINSEPSGLSVSYSIVNATYHGNNPEVIPAGISKNLVFNNFYIDTPSEYGSWDATNTKFTVIKRGIYTIAAGARMRSSDPDITGLLTLMAGNYYFPTGSQKSIDANGVDYYNNSNVSTSVILNPGSEIYIKANSSDASWNANGVYLHIAYARL